ncbi:MAG: hypothetical protein HY421_01380 [Candidatus Kerfeldbacteria bacterium]|nr:hypothetical protein [Candidatus Kerfeldbacteria bacterium]
MTKPQSSQVTAVPCLNKCGRNVSHRVLDAIPAAEVCLKCRMACIDRKVGDRGFAGIAHMGPIKDTRGRYCCIRCLRLLPAERIRSNDRTCVGCQLHLEALNDKVSRLETARNGHVQHVNPRGRSLEESTPHRPRRLLRAVPL